MVRVCCCLCIALVAGCGPADDKLIPVTGSVKSADGSPLEFESGLVVFEPAGAGRSASGGVEKDGTFTMMTQTPGDGVAPGEYKVVVQLWKSYRDQTPALPEKYADAATTPLEAAVDSAHTHFEFTVER